MKKILFSTILTGHIFFATGQNASSDTSLKSLVKLDVGLQGVGLTYEPRISKKITIDLSAGAGGGYNVSEAGVGYEWSVFQPAFYFMVTPKFYYNRKQRIEKGKKFQNNSGNYLGLRLKYTTSGIAPENPLRSAGLINLHWGIQRPIGNQWTINAHVGGGYAQDLTSIFGTIYPALEVKFSYVFSKAAL
jgi:hypothetical protein